MNALISATFDFERALGGPQVQLSQARRHLTEECNPTLGWKTRKNELRDGKKKGRTKQSRMTMWGGKIKTDINRCKGQKSPSVTSLPPGDTAAEVYLVVNAYLVIFYMHVEVMDQMLIPTLTPDG